MLFVLGVLIGIILATAVWWRWLYVCMAEELPAKLRKRPTVPERPCK